VYWFWVDQVLGEAAELGVPRVLRMTRAPPSAPATAGDGGASGAAPAAGSEAGEQGTGPCWDVQLLHTDDGMQLQPAGLRAVLEALGARVGSRLLLCLLPDRCSAQRLHCTVRAVGG
jgi:hypothetical protein